MTRTLRFTKGHGTENDFVLVFDPDDSIGMGPELVRALTHRRRGIGADGVIRAVSRSGRWFMDYWNADGSTAEMCGNGARVFAAFLEREARLDLGHGLTFDTRGGEKKVTARGEGRYAVEMGEWTLPGGGAHDADVAVARHAAFPASTVDMGNPHTVVALESLDELRSLDLSKAPQVTPRPDQGTNVEFVVANHRVSDAEGTRGRVTMRVHERGSGETRSCGTGACAVAVAQHAWAGSGAPTVWDVEVPGGMLTVSIDGPTVVLEGPAVLVADGTLDPDALTGG